MVNSSAQFLTEDEKSSQADVSSLQQNQASYVDGMIKKSKIYGREDSLRTPKVLNQVSLMRLTHTFTLIL